MGAITRLLGGNSELGSGTVAMLSRQAGYSFEKAGQLLNFHPATSLEEGMRLTQEWVLKEHLIPATANR